MLQATHPQSRAWVKSSFRYGLWLALGACLCSSAAFAQSKEKIVAQLQKARGLSQRVIVADTHIDVPYRIYDDWEDVTREAGGDFDLPRAKEGGLNLPFMSIYLPWQSEVDGTAYALANRLIDQVEAIAMRNARQIGVAYNLTEAKNIIASGRLALAMGMENGAAIAGKLENLEHFKRRGISYITLAHSKSNHIADSSYDQNRLWHGLSPFGVELVKAMNRTGVMVDVSHISDEAFWEVLKTTQAPVIASHSSVRHFTPDWERNMSDDMIKALGKQGGLIMINFGSSFINQESNKNYTEFAAARSAFMEQYGIDDSDDSRVVAFTQAYRQKIPFVYATVEQVADHIDHAVKLAGIDHVGLGSDFDGVGDSLPVDLKDVSMYPNLVAVLLARGYKDKDVEKILGANLLRVWDAVEQAGKEIRRAEAAQITPAELNALEPEQTAH